jgi:hypothetical protein
LEPAIQWRLRTSEQNVSKGNEPTTMRNNSACDEELLLPFDSQFFCSFSPRTLSRVRRIVMRNSEGVGVMVDKCG